MTDAAARPRAVERGYRYYVLAVLILVYTSTSWTGRSSASWPRR